MCCLRIGSPRASRADLLARDEPPPETEMGMSIDSWLLARVSVPRAAQCPLCSPAALQESLAEGTVPASPCSHSSPHYRGQSLRANTAI